ncbi:MAG: MBL fold metallo-hydrolase [Gemmatimonas sp.]|uniref:MBL fold metallo-hydrolase n=1 Tax=Gemmatimonas sp. TaxID=1962908 RepID=UPI00391FB19F
MLCQLALAGLAVPLAPTLLHGAGTPIVPRRRVVKQLRITILSTMLADEGLGEWGFAALVEVDGHRLLFDTGAHEDVVARNARELDIALDTVPEVVLSHFHGDHTSGLVALRREVAVRQRTALARAHVADGIFAPRLRDGEARDYNDMNRVRPQYEAAGGSFTVHGKPTEIHPGVWLTGPVPRRHPERNWSVGARPARVQLGAQLVEDTVPDDMAMIIDTDQGLVVLTGCGHAGVVNIIAHARDAVRPAPVHALIGGIHLFNASEQTLAWTEQQLRSFGVRHLIGAHCTGVETVYRFRQSLGLDRSRCVVGAVGQVFDLDRGITPGNIAR